MLLAQRKVFISVLIITNDYRSSQQTHGLMLLSCQHSSASYYFLDPPWDWYDLEKSCDIIGSACILFQLLYVAYLAMCLGQRKVFETFFFICSGDYDIITQN